MMGINLAISRRLISISFTMLLAATHSALAVYPERVIRAIVPFAAGGANDTVARVIGPQLANALGQPVIIDNRPGAAGNIGIDITAKSAPDGYTIIFSASASTQNPALFRKLPYDPIKDIQPIAELGYGPYAIVTNSALPVKNLKELIDYARANPGKLNGAAGGIGTRLSIELFQIKQNLKVEIIPYNGTGPATLAVLSGESDFAIMDTSALIQHLKGDRMRAIAVASGKRLASIPDVLTTIEAGLPDYQTGTTFGVYAAAGTPEPIVKRLHDELNKIVLLPVVAEQFKTLGINASQKTTEQFSEDYRKEIAIWKEIVEKAKIPPVDDAP
jgi:tripartite-type tricarboxylate transporter receptor subunit TctC